MSLAVYDKLLSNFADRCGLRDAKTLRKSRELISLLNSKRSINCSEICKVLICLELAATSTCVNISRDAFVKLSGCTKRNYINNFNNISKLLNLNKIYTIKEICLLVGASQIADTAISLFKKYKETATIDLSAMEHPMYPCAAVLAVCENAKLSVNLPRLVDISRVKKLDLKKLSLEFSKLHDEKSFVLSKDEENSKTDIHKKEPAQIKNDYSRDRTEEISDEKFNDWKRRMLEED